MLQRRRPALEAARHCVILRYSRPVTAESAGPPARSPDPTFRPEKPAPARARRGIGTRIGRGFRVGAAELAAGALSSVQPRASGIEPTPIHTEDTASFHQVLLSGVWGLERRGPRPREEGVLLSSLFSSSSDI